MTSLIDADSIVYILAWQYRENGTEEEVKKACDQFLKDILTLTQATHFLGAFSPDECFRKEIYRYAEYKGNRPDKPEFVTRWEDIIKKHYATEYGFVTDPNLEADDIIAGVGSMYRIANQAFTICSPDKDLRQVYGMHYDYRAKATEGGLVDMQFPFEVTADKAHWNFWTQMLTGDESDNVAGVPGLGPVKAGKIIKDLQIDGDMISTRRSIEVHYKKHFGSFYGSLIMRETEDTLRLMVPVHSLWPKYVSIMYHYIKTAVYPIPVKQSGFFDIAS